MGFWLQEGSFVLYYEKWFDFVKCILFGFVLLSVWFFFFGGGGGGGGDLFWQSSPHQNPRSQILLCGALELLSLQRYDTLSNWNISLQNLPWCFEGGLLTQDKKIKQTKAPNQLKKPQTNATWCEMENVKISKILGFMPFFVILVDLFNCVFFFFFFLLFQCGRAKSLSPEPLFFSFPCLY